MKIDSGMKAVLHGIVRGCLLVFLCIAFRCLVSLLTGGEDFITVYGKASNINGINFNFVKALGVIIAASMCLFFSYSSLKLMFANIGSSLLIYVLLTMFLFAVMLEFPVLLDIFYALNSYDYIHYVFITFPAGLILGSVITLIYHYIKKGVKNNCI